MLIALTNQCASGVSGWVKKPLKSVSVSLGGVMAQLYGVRLAIKRSRVRFPARRGCVTTLGKLFAPNCLDADTLR